MLATGGDCGCIKSAAELAGAAEGAAVGGVDDPFIIASDADFCAEESDVAAFVGIAPVCALNVTRMLAVVAVGSLGSQSKYSSE